MKKTPQWQWDEVRQLGTDYAGIDEVENYERRMGEFRDIAEENRWILKMLKAAPGAKVLEIGCGTGLFARAAASAGYEVTALDISMRMLEYLESKARNIASGSIKTVHGGFLSMDFAPGTFDTVVSSLALHHLPDVWKFIALRNVARVLKGGGQLILRDVVFVLGDRTPEQCFDNFAASIPESSRKNVFCHIKDEFSTYDWILEGLIAGAGFSITDKLSDSGFILTYNCRKI